MQANLQVSIIDKIAYLEFFSSKANSLPSKLLSDLTDNINKLSSNKDCQLILLKSSGNSTFCAGASFDEFKNLKNIVAAENYLMGFGNLILAIKNCEKLVITRVQGKAVGGALGVIAASDYSVACNEADLKLSEVSLGIGPFVIEPALTRKIGIANMSALTFDTEWRSAAWGYNSGLYSKLVGDLAGLDQTVEELLIFLKTKPIDSLLELKKVFWKGSENLEQVLKERAKSTAKFVIEYFNSSQLALKT